MLSLSLHDDLTIVHFDVRNVIMNAKYYIFWANGQHNRSNHSRIVIHLTLFS